MVWGIGSIVILGLFFNFVLNGWPGSVNACTLNTPDTCYCETFDMTAVTAGSPGVRQMVNTWSNLYALFTSLLIALFVFFDRRALSPTATPNLMRSTTFIPDLYVFIVLFLGLGSMFYHGSLTEWGGIFDGLSMYLFAAFLVFYSIRRLWNSAVFFWLGYLSTVAVATSLHTPTTSFMLILTLTAIYLAIELYIWNRTGRVMMGTWRGAILWLSALASILMAVYFWHHSKTGGVLCDPTSLFQPHGLLWHPLAGLTAVLLYFYWRSE